MRSSTILQTKLLIWAFSKGADIRINLIDNCLQTLITCLHNVYTHARIITIHICTVGVNSGRRGSFTLSSDTRINSRNPHDTDLILVFVLSSKGFLRTTQAFAAAH